MQRLPVVVAATLLVLAGCGGGSDDGDASPARPAPSTSPAVAASSQPPTSATPAATQAPDPAARRTLRSAQRALVEADTGTVETAVVVGPDRIETLARYEISSRSMQAETTVVSPDERLVTESIAIGKDAWVRLSRTSDDDDDDDDDDEQTCWMTADPAAIEATTGVDVTQGVRGFPPALMVAVNALGTIQIEPDRVQGRVDLYSLTSNISGRLPIALGLDVDDPTTAPVAVQLEDGVVTGWRTSLVDVLRAAEEAGLELPSELQGYEEATMIDARLEAGFSDLGAAASITPPPADQVVDIVADQEEFRQAMEACQVRQG